MAAGSDELRKGGEEEAPYFPVGFSIPWAKAAKQPDYAYRNVLLVWKQNSKEKTELLSTFQQAELPDLGG